MARHDPLLRSGALTRWFLCSLKVCASYLSRSMLLGIALTLQVWRYFLKPTETTSHTHTPPTLRSRVRAHAVSRRLTTRTVLSALARRRAGPSCIDRSYEFFRTGGRGTALISASGAGTAHPGAE